MFDTATSNTGTLETGNLAGMPRDALQAIGVESHPDMFSSQEISTFTAKTKGAMIFEDCLGVCRFTTRSPTRIASWTSISQPVAAFTACVRYGTSVRVVNLLRAFNIRHGIGPELDVPSKRYGSTPLDGPAAGVSIQPDWSAMLANYYQLLGWDETGVPRRATLEALGLGRVADDLRASA
jgi:aldehyde:ferredoxin oxidoreductase